MEFHSELPGGDTLMVASIAGVNAGLSAPTMESLDDLKHHHTREVTNIQERYAHLYQAGNQRSAFQSIKSVLLSEERKSALGCIGLPGGVEHDHDSYYHAHPAVLDGMFQLITLVDQSLEGESWEPAGISCVSLQRTGGFHQRDREILVHVMLVEDGLRVKSYDIQIFDQHGIIMLMNGVRYLKHGERVPPVLTLSSRLSLKNNARDVGIIAFEYYCPLH